MIRLRGVCRSFKRLDEGAINVLKNLDFDVERGEFVAIVGPSGSGKTTLMNILGLLDRADSGDYRLLGKSVATQDSASLARMRNQTLGFVFQQFHLLPRTTAIENVELPLIYAQSDLKGRQARERAIETLCRVGLEERLHHYPNQLSGGQQQRVAIARALVNSPDIVLADEPTGNLDSDSAHQLMDLFAGLNADGTTLLLITHAATVARRAGRMVRIHQGQLFEGDSPVAGSRQ